MPCGTSGITVKNFGLASLEHEYGHYLQSQEYGEIYYNAVIAPASLLNAALPWNSVVDHWSYWTEKEANFMAVQFFGPISAIATYSDPRHFPIH